MEVAMRMKILSSTEVAREVVRELGLDPEIVEITSTEVISALVRRTAGLQCPCPRKRILKNVLQSLVGVVPDSGELREVVDDSIDTLVAHGDLLEHNDITRESTRSEVVLNRAPLVFVKRESGACVLLGIAPDDRPVLPDFLHEKIQYNNFNRVIPADAALDVSAHLLSLGFIELPYKAWSRCPAAIAPDKHIAAIDRHFVSSLAHFTDTIEGLRFLDPSTSVDYYPNRWVVPKKHTGRFVGRRPQAYGADVWCYVEMERGKPKRFLDLPLPGSRWRGCDEAWHLQAAIDASCGKSQHYKLREGARDLKILDLLSPVPSWAQRRWVMVGMPVSRHQCLMSFRFRSVEIREEIRFAKDHLWLSEKTGHTG
jgi:hypothetical protein